MEQTRRDIEAETRRALDEIRKEVADLTVIATEKVTRKTLDDEDHQRLIEEALEEVDFSALAGGRLATAPATAARRGAARLGGGDRRGLRALAVRGGAGAGQARRRSTSSSASSPTRSTRTASCRCSSSRPTSPRRRRRRASRKVVEGADEHFVHFLELLAERHRMPVLFRIRRAFDELWAEENKLLPVTITSAVELDEETVEGRSASEIEEQTGQTVELDQPRRPRRARRAGAAAWATWSWTPASAAASKDLESKCARGRLKEDSRHADQARRDHEHPQEPHRGPRRRRRRPVRGRHRAVDRRRHRARARPRQLHVARDARAPARRDRPRAEPRVRQRRRRAVRRLGQDRGGRHRSSAPGRLLEIPVGEALLGRIVDPLGNPLDGKGDIDDRRRRARPSSRRPASCSASRWRSRCRPASRRSTR